MRVGACLSLAVVTAVLLRSSPCSANTWADLVPALTKQVTSFWQNNELEFMGHTCYYGQVPRIRQWKLYYHGTFSCPAWTSLSGNSNTVNHSSVRTETIQNFLIQARDTGLVTPEEATIWLRG